MTRNARSHRAVNRFVPSVVKPIPEVLARETIVPGKKYDYDRLTVRTASVKTVQREMVRHPGAVVIVPILDDGRIVLIRNYRILVQKWLVECCAGTIENGDPPAETAARELIEETGYSTAKLTSLGYFYTTPGLTDEKMHPFVATGLTHVGQELEDDETIEVLSVAPAEAFALIERGEMVDAKSMLALHLARQRGHIKL